ncbi:hypothetical protein R5R35_000798 [Gryllus longicercus]|uniref:DNA oxidative demethylase ALKBH2 n=1 Tax=Gryllus longicercus TaxID=2509291 RepID=A0AAN9W3M8_9ORTH
MAAREPLQWRKLAAEGLDCDYCLLLPRAQADALFRRLEDELEYFKGDLTRIFVYGKWHDIPRQQVSFGDEGLSYKFSGTTVPARPWPPALLPLRDLVRRVAGVHFNFVLVNRYRDGRDHIGEHRDDEADLDRGAPIASVSLGQTRTFVLRHGDARRPGPRRQALPPVKIDLEHGSLLMMNYPTNRYWYHSLPPRKSSPGVRLNLTFRKMAEKSNQK